ncbi:type I-C CRISPR-associated protein Cas8c/Csd1 [Mannheimia varigena]|uniref:type I-C CRISPR-associated protein Cas8c/Csd1 n=1 Tax=Mannheimia varigena TaxID=85404 RepID=UPI000DBF02FB|nr:type I-C CRISPR-associated protein Cas8c/Csd1 [Mannheimia varigena]AWW34984.1 type I-C CRISPR-associated protein Cas8c/Csd1 [Mannheimia varigena]
MSWMQKLYRTYNEVEKNPELLDSDKLMFAPLWHSPQTAHINITLDGEGNFIRAKVLSDKPILMLPVTESSEGRTSGLAPHALADSLQYIAKDLGLTFSEEIVKEVEADNGKKKKIKEKVELPIFKLYSEQLDSWCAYTKNPKIHAIKKYVHKGTVLSDLIKAKVIPTDENGQLLNNWSEKENNGRLKPELFNVLTKEQGKFEIRKALVVWSVEIPNDLIPETWKDTEVQRDWGEYYQSTLKSQFCSILGKESEIRESHPAKLTYSGDKAKLISANDKEGYTFRGRFENANQASSISAEVSHKVHASLRWLIDRQGIRNGEQVTVAWAISGKEVPSPLQDPFQNFDFDNADTSAVENNAEFQTSADSETTPDWSANIGKEAANIIKKKYHGYKAKLEHHEQISLLMLDSATPGRMALTYYQEFLPKDYFANLDAWLDDFTWFQRHTFEVKGGKKNEKRTLWLELPPSPFAIAQAVYGKSLNDTLKKQLYARLLPVIAGGKSVPIPYDLVQKSFQVACNPHCCDTWEWQRNIGVACGLYRGWRARHHKESERRTYDMSLDIKNRSRDYLYGRLLAVAENIESYALYLAGEKRSTNAERYMQQFADRPYYTWRNLELALRPYQERLKNNGKDTGRQAISEIMELFATEDYLNDEKLSGEFLLGYHCQKMEIARQVAELKAKSAKQTEE